MAKKISLQRASSLFEAILADTNDQYHRIQKSNATALQQLLSVDESSSGFQVEYTKDTEIVHEGEMVTAEVKSNPELTYARVPLGVITSGSVVVLKDGKGTKTLGPGDFIGLFETSHWLLTERSRQIGDWTLFANDDCEIVFFGSSLLIAPHSAEFKTYLVELARADHVPQPISTLPFLDWVASHTTRSRLPNCAIIAHTHLLPNSLPFFRHLSHLVAPGRIFILEKPYSTVRSVFSDLVRSGYDVTQVSMEDGVPYEFATKKSTEVMWRKVIESQKKNGFTELLIVDDGGDLWLSLPWEELKGVQIVGVEQTQRGITRILGSSLKTPPIISVASSGIKKLIESEFIGIAIVKKLNEWGVIASAKQIGILGVGDIGSAVQRALTSDGRTAICYDPVHRVQADAPSNAVSSIDVLLNKCDLIIGTVGSDSITGTALERVSGSKTLISASSADVEFGSLLKLAEPTVDVFGTRIVKVHEDLDLQILNGGYPANFDRLRDSTPDEDIVLTRCLLYIGAMQAAYILSKRIIDQDIYNLDKISQKNLLEKWIEYKKELDQTSFVKKEDVDRIVSYSSLKDAKETPTVWE